MTQKCGIMTHFFLQKQSLSKINRRFWRRQILWRDNLNLSLTFDYMGGKMYYRHKLDNGPKLILEEIICLTFRK